MEYHETGGFLTVTVSAAGFFTPGYILKPAEDRAWLDKAKDTLSSYWEEARSRKKEAQA